MDAEFLRNSAKDNCTLDMIGYFSLYDNRRAPNVASSSQIQYMLEHNEPVIHAVDRARISRPIELTKRYTRVLTCSGGTIVYVRNDVLNPRK